MTKKTAPPVVSPLLDAAGNPSLVSAGELIESAWGNSVSDRVIKRYPNQGSLPASAAEGSVAIITDAHVIWVRVGGSWRPTADGRYISFRAVGGAAQPLPSNVLTNCTWTTEASDDFGVLASGVFTVPAAWAGRWGFNYSVTIGAGDTGTTQTWIETPDALRWAFDVRPIVAGAGATVHGGTATIVLPAGSTVVVKAFTAGVDTSMNASGSNYFQGYYVGIS